ncbi:MAG: hypothetical protein GF320_20650 [Armatimonadia bacterium]|nr:hypothetical protein [Armatimonadia bacterium]
MPVIPRPWPGPGSEFSRAQGPSCRSRLIIEEDDPLRALVRTLLPLLTLALLAGALGCAGGAG